MNFLDRTAIKKEARAFISPDKKWFYMFLAILPYLFVTNLFTVVYTVKTGAEFGEGMYYQVQGSSWSFIGNIIKLLAIPFGIAVSGYFLNHLRGFNPEWKSLYREGKDRFGKYFEVGFITAIVIFLWSLLFVIPGIIKGYAYSQVDYIIHDNPTLSSQDARKMSDIMTKGLKGELFIKDLSFILWDLLVLCTCGIATIYVTPYILTVNAMYYENLKNHAIEAGLIAPEAFGIVSQPEVQQSAEAQEAQTYNYNYAAPVAPATHVAPVAPVATDVPVAPEESAEAVKDESSFIDDTDMDFDPSSIRTEEFEIPTAPERTEVPEDRPIILNGEEYKPED